MTLPAAAPQDSGCGREKRPAEIPFPHLIAARNFNLVDIIADDAEDLMGYALKEARTLAELPAGAFASIKRQLRGDTITKIETAMAAGANEPANGWFTEETVPAMTKVIG